MRIHYTIKLPHWLWLLLLLPAGVIHAQPGAPANFRVVATDVNRILLAWDAVDDATAYKIYTSQDSITFSEAATVTDTNLIMLNGLDAATEYDFLIKAYDMNGDSAMSVAEGATVEAAMLMHLPLNELVGDTAVMDMVSGAPIAFEGELETVDVPELGISALRFVHDELDGIQSYVPLSEAVQASGLGQSLMSRSVTFWMKNDQPSLYSVPLSFGKRTGLAVAVKNDSLWVFTKHRVMGPEYQDGFGIPFTSSEWTHIAYVYHEPYTDLYVNGEFVGSVETTEEWPYPQRWLFGGDKSYEIGAQVDPDLATWRFLGDNFDPGYRNPFFGAMADMKLYNYEISAADIAAEYNAVVAPAPSRFNVAAKDVDRLLLRWDAVEGVDGVRLYMSADSTDFTEIADIQDGSTTHMVTGLDEGATYYFQAVTYNANGESAVAAAVETTVTKMMNMHLPLDAIVGDTAVMEMVSGAPVAFEGELETVDVPELGVLALRFVHDELEGTQSYVPLSEAVQASGLGQSLMSRSVTFWMKNDQPSLYSVPLSFGKRTGLAVAIQNDSLWVFTKHRVMGPAYQDGFGIPFTSSEWTHIAYVYHEPYTDLYVNGEFVGSVETTDEWPYPQRWLFGDDKTYEIGAQVDPDLATWRFLGDNFDPGYRNPFFGAMADMKLYNYEISAADIAAEYNAVLAPVPSRFNVAAKDVDRLLLRWDAVEGVDGVRLYMSADSTDFTEIADIQDGSTTHMVTGLDEGATYYFHAVTYNANGESAVAAAVETTVTKMMNMHLPLDAIVGDTAVMEMVSGAPIAFEGQLEVVESSSTGLNAPAIRFIHDELGGVQSYVPLSEAVQASGLGESLMSRTVSFWMKNDQPSLYSVPLSFGKRTGLTVAVQNDSLWVFTKHRVMGPAYQDGFGIPFTSSEWTHIAYVYSDPVTELYVNGEFVGSVTTQEEWPYPQRWLFNDDKTYEIGAQVDPDLATWRFLGDNFDPGYRNPFFGEMANVRLYNHALTPDEVMQLASEVTNVEEVWQNIRTRVYPNPASDRLFIETELHQLQVTVFDQWGRAVHQEVVAGNRTLDVQRLPAGLYYLHLQSESRLETLPFIIKR